MTGERQRREERASFAKHVVAVYDYPRVRDEDGEYIPQEIDLHCEKCDAKWKVTCRSGAIRSHLMHFAVSHVHADAFKEE